MTRKIPVQRTTITMPSLDQAITFLGNVNSRMKDFYDLWILAKRFEFKGNRLQTRVHSKYRQPIRGS